jgi:hypothetical protein
MGPYSEGVMLEILLTTFVAAFVLIAVAGLSWWRRRC